MCRLLGPLSQYSVPVSKMALTILIPFMIAPGSSCAFLSCYYDQVRSRFRDLFVAHDMTTFLTGNPAHRVALFLTACREARASFRQVRYRANYPDLDLSSHIVVCTTTLYPASRL